MSALPLLRSGARHLAGNIAEAALIALLLLIVAALLAPIYRPANTIAGGQTAEAARRTTASISVGNGFFSGTTTATALPGGADVWVFAECVQNGRVVKQQYSKLNADNQVVIYLGPTPSWSSGGATCRADEGTWVKGSRWRAMASTTFEVAG